MLYDGLSLGSNSSACIMLGNVFPPDPIAGALFFKTDTDTVYVFKNDAWVAVAGPFTLDRSHHTGIVPIAGGGNGASTATEARVNLGLDIGSDVQAYNINLANIANTVGTGFLKKTDGDAWVLDSSTYLTTNQPITLSGDIAGSGKTAIVATLANVNSTAGTYGSGIEIPVLTVNTKGLVTKISSTLIDVAFNITGDVSGTITGSDNTLTLAAVNANVGTIGSASSVPVITVNDKGLITAVSTAPISAGALSDFSESVQAAVGAFIINGGGITASYSDISNTLTLGSTATDANMPQTIVARDAFGNFSAGTITAALMGHASTATSASTAASAALAATVTVADDVGTAATVYPAWVASDGKNAVKVSSTRLSFIPSTGALTATAFVGALIGNASTANHISGGAAGSILYQSSANVTAKLAQGTQSQVLISGVAPSWTNTPTLTGTNFTGIPNAGLLNPFIIVGTTKISLGATTPAITGLASVSAAVFNGTLNGNATTATSASTAVSAATSATANVLNVADSSEWPGGSTAIAANGSRTIDLAPNTFSKVIAAELKSSSLFGNSGNYTGLITFAPWLSTTASTGDPAYQLSFNPAAGNSIAPPSLKIRAGIDTSWGAWSTILHSNNFNAFAPSLTGIGATGTWSITAANAMTLTDLPPSSSASPSTIAVRDGNGHLFAVYLNQASPNDENTSVAQVLTTNGRDNVLRKASVPALSASLTGVPNSALVNSSVTVGKTKITLGETVTALAGLETITAGEVLSFSDDRTKQNVKPITDALSKVETLHGVTFEHAGGTNRIAGVMTQEVQTVLPEVVQDGEIPAIAYGNMVALLVEAIKDLSQQNKALLERVQLLEAAAKSA